jgi:glyoxylase-like metal-dependent hydrolase (beta-lactamase superfamily II)
MQEPLIQQITVGPLQVNTYLVACPVTRQGVVVDPGGEEERILELARTAQVSVRYILNTHGHGDHTLGNMRLKEALRVPVAMHGDDDDFFATDEELEALEGHLTPATPLRADLRLSDGQTLEVGQLSIRVIHTPGHSPGSVCFLVGEHLFTGDTLFVGAVGRTDLPGASLDELLASLREKILPLPPSTKIWPGHDYGETPTSTLARECLENPFITDFILDV